MKFCGVDGIVLYGIAGADHVGPFQTRHRRHHRRLNVDRHARRHAVHVYLIRVEALGFEEQLVARLIRKLDYLILDRRTVARSDTFDLATV